MDDEIMKEVRAIRESYAARFACDVQALFADAKESEKREGREVVSLEPKYVQPEDEGREVAGNRR